MKNKCHHQCWAEVQYICYNTISFPHYSKFQRTLLLIFDAIARTPLYLLVTPPYYYMQVQLCLWTPLQPPCRDQTKVFPGNFLDEAKLCTELAVGWTLDQKCPKRSRSCRQQNTMDQGWHHYHSFMEVCYYYTTTYFYAYLLSKLISEKESFNLFYEMLLIPPRCYRFTPKSRTKKLYRLSGRVQHRSRQIINSITCLSTSVVRVDFSNYCSVQSPWM